MFRNTSSPHTSYISNTSSQYIFSTIHLLQKVICSISSALPREIFEKFLATKFNFSIKVASVGPGTIKRWTLSFLILEAFQKWLQKDYFEKHFPVASFGNICTGKKVLVVKYWLPHFLWYSPGVKYVSLKVAPSHT